MQIKLVFITIALCTLEVLGLDLVETDEANLNQLPLEVGKSLVRVQKGLARKLKLDSVSEAKIFVQDVQYLANEVYRLPDEAFGGLAGRIKAILNDEQLSPAYKINVNDFEKYSSLDEKDGPSEYLSRKRFHKLRQIGAALKKDHFINQLLSKPFERVLRDNARQLLDNSVEDTVILFGELMEQKRFQVQLFYKRECQITDVKTICKLVRRTKDDSVTALGSDFADFIDALRSNNTAYIDAAIKRSAVSIGEARAWCELHNRSLYAIYLIKMYEEEGWLSHNEVEKFAQSNEKFDFYYQLKTLCDVLATGESPAEAGHLHDH